MKKINKRNDRRFQGGFRTDRRTGGGNAFKMHQEPLESEKRKILEKV